MGRPKKYYAKVMWTVEDVLDHAEMLDLPITPKGAKRFMERNERKLQDLLVERGNEAIMDILQFEAAGN